MVVSTLIPLIQDKDIAYEAALRRSCFDVPTALSQPVLSKLPTIIAESVRRIPCESRNGPRIGTYYREADFASTSAKHPALLEECFEGYAEWLEEPFDLPTVVTRWYSVEAEDEERTVLGWCGYIVTVSLPCGSTVARTKTLLCTVPVSRMFRIVLW